MYNRPSVGLEKESRICRPPRCAMHRPAGAKGAKGSAEATGTGSKAGLPRSPFKALIALIVTLTDL